MPPPPPPPPRGIPPRAIAPGSVPRAPLSKNPPALHPQPKPKGPPPGGKPPFGTKPPKPGYPASPNLKGLGKFQGKQLPGHADFHSSKMTNGQVVGRTLGTDPRGKPARPVDVASAALSKADDRRQNRIVAKSPAVQQANAAITKAQPGASRTLTVPIPPGRTPPMQKVARALPPGVKGPINVTHERANAMFVKLEKTEAGLIRKTIHGVVPKKAP
jgi:hypothetical protein